MSRVKDLAKHTEGWSVWGEVQPRNMHVVLHLRFLPEFNYERTLARNTKMRIVAKTALEKRAVDYIMHNDGKDSPRIRSEKIADINERINNFDMTPEEPTRWMIAWKLLIKPDGTIYNAVRNEIPVTLGGEPIDISKDKRRPTKEKAYNIAGIDGRALYTAVMQDEQNKDGLLQRAVAVAKIGWV